RLLYTLLYSSEHPVPTRVYSLSLHDALPISTLMTPTMASSRNVTLLPRWETWSDSDCTSRCIDLSCWRISFGHFNPSASFARNRSEEQRLNSSHGSISYAVFCLKKKNMTRHS